MTEAIATRPAEAQLLKAPEVDNHQYLTFSVAGEVFAIDILNTHRALSVEKMALLTEVGKQSESTAESASMDAA